MEFCTRRKKPLHSLQYEESRFLYVTNTCIINYHELSVLIHSLEKSTTVDLIFEIEAPPYRLSLMMGQFLRRTCSHIYFYSTGQKENVTKLFRSFSAAWDQVRLHLSSQGSASISCMNSPWNITLLRINGI